MMVNDDDFVVIHQMAISGNYLGKVWLKWLSICRRFALKQGIYNIKADTNFDNILWLKFSNKWSYTLCGLVYLRDQEKHMRKYWLNLLNNRVKRCIATMNK
jgi:hypothetical protein